jgi:hypothetical protein
VVFVAVNALEVAALGTLKYILGLNQTVVPINGWLHDSEKGQTQDQILQF